MSSRLSERACLKNYGVESWKKTFATDPDLHKHMHIYTHYMYPYTHDQTCTYIHTYYSLRKWENKALVKLYEKVSRAGLLYLMPGV